MTPRIPSEAPLFARLGPATAPTPLVLAVPHAGRFYSAALLAQARLDRAALETIEDRHVDLLIEGAVRLGAVAIVARTARALIDLNRDPREIDTSIVRSGAVGLAAIGSAKVAGGLGVVPSRIAAGGAVWRQPFSAAEIAHRIDTVHRPYHEAIAAALAAAQEAHGVAVLIDCHSMPPLPPPARAQLVIGDRHGCSADGRFVRVAAGAARRLGLAVALNRPYAGGHTLDHHGAPDRGRHAVQIEIDRSLYLDTRLREPGPGLARARALVEEIARAVIDEATGLALAAE